MGTIDGINPIIMDSIKVTTQKPAIKETQRSKVSEDKKDRDKKDESSPSPVKPRELEKAVEKLNQRLLINKIPLYFRIYREKSEIWVKLISADQQKVISEFSPERILRMAVKLDTRGFTVDELI